jgi:hypothetical protein
MGINYKQNDVERIDYEHKIDVFSKSNRPEVEAQRNTSQVEGLDASDDVLEVRVSVHQDS